MNGHAAEYIGSLLRPKVPQVIFQDSLKKYESSHEKTELTWVNATDNLFIREVVSFHILGSCQSPSHMSQFEK